MRKQSNLRGGLGATLVAGLAIVLVGCGGAAQPSAGGDGKSARCEEPVDITFRLNWIRNYNQLPMTVAAHKGWYKDQCLDVTIQGGKGSADTVQVVATGAAQVGIADAVAVIQGQEKGLPVTATGVLWRENAFAVVIRSEALDDKTPEPKDLYGLKFGAVTTGSPYIFWKAFVNQQGLDPSKIDDVSLSPPGFAEMANGSVDFLANFRGSQHILEAQGVPITVLEAADYGQQGYGLTVFANSRWLSDHGDAMTRFLRASARGMIWAGNHPKKAIDILAKYESNVEVQIKPFKGSIDFWGQEGAAAPEEFLRFNMESVEKTQQLLYDSRVLTGEATDLSEQWTTEYLPKPSTYMSK